MNFKGKSAQQIAEHEQLHVTAKSSMADAQKFKKSRNMIRIERMFIFKQKIRYGLKFILRIVQRKIFMLY